MFRRTLRGALLFVPEQKGYLIWFWFYRYITGILCKDFIRSKLYFTWLLTVKMIKNWSIAYHDVFANGIVNFITVFDRLYFGSNVWTFASPAYCSGPLFRSTVPVWPTDPVNCSGSVYWSEIGPVSDNCIFFNISLLKI